MPPIVGNKSRNGKPTPAELALRNQWLKHGKVGHPSDGAIEIPPSEPDPVRPIIEAEGRTDATNSRRLVARFGNKVRWVGPWDKWLVWDGKRWKTDQSLRIEAHAKEIAAGLWLEIAKATNSDRDTLTKMISFARTSNSNNGVRNMVALARSDRYVVIQIEDLDRDPWLLNLENGTLDLRTGKLREHRKGDFITKLAPVRFDPKATCPLWEKFVFTIFDGNPDLINYVRQLIGYCLTAVTREHILPFLYGTGANGKSTLCETIMKLMGPDYAMKAAPDLLMAKRLETHPTDRADLFGKRLVCCIETEEDRRMAEALVKELTGGDRIRARRMREDFWEFAPSHHVWLAGNHKPTISGTDHGIWRRLKLIPFEVVIPDDEQDKRLPEKLAGELPGILNWAIEGCLSWQRDGFSEPATVKDATKEYAEEMDQVGQFLDEACEVGPAFTAPATELFRAYHAANPGSRMSQQSFGAALRRRGFERTRFTSGPNKAKHGWKGLRLQSDVQREAAQKLYAALQKKARG
jgi:putative DNA primase/helicase